MGEAKISIITPVYNGEDTINNCIKSVANQSYEHFEHLFIDGCSSDGTLTILNDAVSNYPKLKFVSEKDKGIYDAMNNGLKKSEGDWIYFLGVDDEFYDDHVLSSLFGESDMDNYDIVYGAIVHRASKKSFFHEFDARRLSLMNMSHQGLFVRKKVFQTIGDFKLKYKSLADYEHNMRWFGDDRFKIKYQNRNVALYNEEGFSTVFFDKPFYDDKLSLIKDHLGIDGNHAGFPEAANLVCNIQLKNKDYWSAVKSAIKASVSSKKSFYLRRAIREVLKRVFS